MDPACRSTRTAVAVLAAVFVYGFGCGDTSTRHELGDAEPIPHIALNTSPDRTSTVDVTLPATDLAELQASELTHDDWVSLFRVSVATKPADTADRLPVLGSYAVVDGVIRFAPRYPFDPGRRYRVVFDPTRLPSDGDVSDSWRTLTLSTTVREPSVTRSATTRVVRVYPSADVIPENQPRFYIAFSAPMGFAGGVDHVRLIDEDDAIVEDAFLPLDVAMWNRDRTRYTLLFDPGRVKRGILPNERMGRPLIEGRGYRLVVDDAWLDDNGQSLVESYSHPFRVGPSIERAIDPTVWEIEVPPAGTREALTVSFERPLDYALLQRALLVSTASGPLGGDIEIGAAETIWRFTPDDPWGFDEHYLTALSILEDPTGNRVGRPFEVGISDAVTRADDTPTTLSFLPTN